METKIDDGLARNDPKKTRPIPMRDPRSRLAHACALLCFLAPCVESQEVVTTQRAPQCATCTIERRLYRTLDSTSFDGSYVPREIHRAPGDKLWVTSWPGKDGRPPQLFDANSRLEREIGRLGSGPLEFRAAPLMVRTARDSFLVFDPVLGRITVVDADGRLGRGKSDAAVSRLWQVVALPGGHFVASGSVRAQGRVGFPLHELNESLALVRSFGTAETDLGPSLDRSLNRAVAAAQDSGFWSAGGKEYRIEKWSKNLSLEKVVARKASWFEVDRSADAEFRPDPKPTIVSVYEDSAGLLWICSLVADKNWRRSVEPFKAGTRTRYRVPDRNEYNDTVIEVFDARSLRLLASARFDESMLGVFDDGLTGAIVLAADASPAFRVWQLTLRSSTRQ